MKRKCICFFLGSFIIIAAYGASYYYFSSPADNLYISDEPLVIPVTAGKENFILPETVLVMKMKNLKSGIEAQEILNMPSIYLGLEREELILLLDDYMQNLSVKEREAGLVSYEIESFSTKELVLKKIYYPEEDYDQFYMIYKNGRMVVYHSDLKTVYDYPDIQLYELPLDVQCKVLSGIKIKDEIELYNFLQNYSS